MREILFRGKRVDNGEWVKGFYVEANHHWHNKGVHKEWIVKNVIQNGGWCNVASKYAVIPETVGQYTGLTDKNGTKIFEGDIVRLINEEYTVRFGIAGFELLRKVVSVPIGTWYGTDAIGDDGTLFEVIGNIHDNPELLKEDKL